MTDPTDARELNTTALLGPILREGLDRDNVRRAIEAAWENGRVHEPRINQHEAVIEKDGVMVLASTEATDLYNLVVGKVAHYQSGVRHG